MPGTAQICNYWIEPLARDERMQADCALHLHWSRKQRIIGGTKQSHSAQVCGDNSTRLDPVTVEKPLGAVEVAPESTSILDGIPVRDIDVAISWTTSICKSGGSAARSVARQRSLGARAKQFHQCAFFPRSPEAGDSRIAGAMLHFYSENRRFLEFTAQETQNPIFTHDGTENE